MYYVIYNKASGLYLALDSNFDLLGWVNRIGDATPFSQSDASRFANHHGGKPIKIEVYDSGEWTPTLHDYRFFMR